LLVVNRGSSARAVMIGLGKPTLLLLVSRWLARGDVMQILFG